MCQRRSLTDSFDARGDARLPRLSVGGKAKFTKSSYEKCKSKFTTLLREEVIMPFRFHFLLRKFCVVNEQNADI